jgi:hypothetical protein
MKLVSCVLGDSTERAAVFLLLTGLPWGPAGGRLAGGHRPVTHIGACLR